MNTVYLGLGSNLGDRERNLARGLESLAERMMIKKVSSIYETEPLGYLDQPWFLNMACSGTTQLDPFELLRYVKDIEGQLGRAAGFPNAPRPIDIDILFYAQWVIEDQYLVIPHPRIGERAFVLIPLVEIAPDLAHPSIGKTTRDLLSGLTEAQQVRRWRDVPCIRPAAL
ncbi:2-amino-4-hydroxy-6-hydroxymethyldihydropteridine diphosphokinase [Dehalococcoidia bacterium]|nr:2-amino-4-hydroxy-6-hydroxymethyldihydropteridine diphosphokinase [Dehalococcoidia bacterium]